MGIPLGSEQTIGLRMDIAAVGIGVFSLHDLLGDDAEDGELRKSPGLRYPIWPASE